jgi:hypothetical protein
MTIAEIAVSKGENGNYEIYNLRNGNSNKKVPKVEFGKNCKTYEEIVSYSSSNQVKKIRLENIDDIIDIAPFTPSEVKHIKEAFEKQNYVIDFL